MLTMGGNQVKVFQSLIRTNTNWFVVRSHWRLCSNTEASYSCELTSWHLPRLVERWTGNIPFYGWTELLFSSEAALYHKHVQWLILLKVRLIHSCRKKQDNEILLMLCEIDEPFIYFPKLNFFVPRDLLANPIFDVCVTEKCLSNLPSPELIKHQYHRISMILDLLWYWCMILYHTPVSFICLFIILHLWVP